MFFLSRSSNCQKSSQLGIAARSRHVLSRRRVNRSCVLLMPPICSQLSASFDVSTIEHCLDEIHLLSSEEIQELLVNVISHANLPMGDRMIAFRACLLAWSVTSLREGLAVGSFVHAGCEGVSGVGKLCRSNDSERPVGVVCDRPHYSRWLRLEP